MSLDHDDWNQHWQKLSDASSLSPSRIYRRKLIFSLIKKLNKTGMKILDLGSGQGEFALELTSEFPTTEVCGIELSMTGVEISKKKVPNARFIQMDLLSEKNPLPEFLQHGADVAICSEVLEHLDEPLLLLKNIKKFLHKDSDIIITVPSGPRSAFERHIGHRKHFNALELRTLLETAGYQVKEIFNAGFPFFNLYKLLIMLRGKQIINDCSQPSRFGVIKWVSVLFNMLCQLNLTKSPWGWQLVAVVKKR